MLSKCPQVRVLCTLATEKLGEPLSVIGTFYSSSEKLGTMTLTGTDTQKISLVSGDTSFAQARDINELISAFQKAVPGIFLFTLNLQITTPHAQRMELISCAPMNPELIATAAKRMLRSMLLDK